MTDENKFKLQELRLLEVEKLKEKKEKIAASAKQVADEANRRYVKQKTRMAEQARLCSPGGKYLTLTLILILILALIGWLARRNKRALLQLRRLGSLLRQTQ